jgi:hypothetical protein
MDRSTAEPQRDGQDQVQEIVGEEDQLKQHSLPAAELPSPETTEEWKGLPSRPQGGPVSKVGATSLQARISMLMFAQKGRIGAIIRSIKGIPPCVWVINQHVEDITVVVSKYKPNRLLTGGGLQVSSTGGGVNFSATVCYCIVYIRWPFML